MDLLIELFSEEIPARMQPKAREDLRRLMTDGLVEAVETLVEAVRIYADEYIALHLDEVAEAFDGWDGPLKVQVCGPWTSAAAIERHRSGRARPLAAGPRRVGLDPHAT